ncbi:hypothetical protein HDK64DRAFT_46369 [Phyllosticta capitalensis]
MSHAFMSGLSQHLVLLQRPAQGESVNEKGVRRRGINKNCVGGAPEGDSYQVAAARCNAGLPGSGTAFLTTASPTRSAKDVSKSSMVG